jgi:hypothetical protein
MKKIIITLDLSADLLFTVHTIKCLGNLCRHLFTTANSREMCILSDEDETSKVCSEIIRQILDLEEEVKLTQLENTTGADLLMLPRLEDCLTKDFEVYDVVIIVSKDKKEILPRMHALTSEFLLGKVIDTQPIFICN